MYEIPLLFFFLFILSNGVDTVCPNGITGLGVSLTNDGEILGLGISSKSTPSMGTEENEAVRIRRMIGNQAFDVEINCSDYANIPTNTCNYFGYGGLQLFDNIFLVTSSPANSLESGLAIFNAQPNTTPVLQYITEEYLDELLGVYKKLGTHTAMNNELILISVILSNETGRILSIDRSNSFPFPLPTILSFQIPFTAKIRDIELDDDFNLLIVPESPNNVMFHYIQSFNNENIWVLKNTITTTDAGTADQIRLISYSNGVLFIATTKKYYIYKIDNNGDFGTPVFNMVSTFMVGLSSISDDGSKIVITQFSTTPKTAFLLHDADQSGWNYFEFEPTNTFVSANVATNGAAYISLGDRGILQKIDWSCVSNSCITSICNPDGFTSSSTPSSSSAPLMATFSPTMSPSQTPIITTTNSAVMTQTTTTTISASLLITPSSTNSFTSTKSPSITPTKTDSSSPSTTITVIPPTTTPTRTGSSSPSTTITITPSNSLTPQPFLSNSASFTPVVQSKSPVTPTQSQTPTSSQQIEELNPSLSPTITQMNLLPPLPSSTEELFSFPTKTKTLELSIQPTKTQNCK